MKKDLEKLLKELNKTVKDFVKEHEDEMCDEINERMEEAYKEECELSVKKGKGGDAQVVMKGSTLAILITLAGLEKSVFKKTKVPSNVWEVIQKSVGVRDGDK